MTLSELLKIDLYLISTEAPAGDPAIGTLYEDLLKIVAQLVHTTNRAMYIERFWMLFVFIVVFFKLFYCD